MKTLTALALLTSPALAQTTSSSSFNWDSLISQAATETTSFDLYTTNGSLGPGQLDTSSRAGLFTSATPVVGPIGNGTVANGTMNGNGTAGGAGNASATTTGGSGGGAAGTASGGSGSETGGAGSSSGSVSAPAATGNVAAGGERGLWVEGAGLLVGLGALMAAL